MVRVTVPIPGRSYDVVVGDGVMDVAGDHLPPFPEAKAAFVVADRTVAARFSERLGTGLRRAGLEIVPLSVPAGEAAKTLQVYGALLHQMATQEAHRDDVVVALGGGATGDIAGFVAATYMRGVALVQVPTTLTGQVDAAIGGKAAVNLPEGKNLVGVFAQPRVVLADVGALRSLDDRAYRSGLAEVAKYGLTLDLDLLTRLEANPAPILEREPKMMEAVVGRCVEAKATAVAQDERDKGARLILNYGHTLGHALERLDAYAGFTHGEAIAVGMLFAARLAESTGIAEPGLVGRTARLLNSLGLETHGQLPPADDILSALRMDKKYHGAVRFVLLKDVGRPIVVDDLPEAQVRAVLETMGAAA